MGPLVPRLARLLARRLAQFEGAKKKHATDTDPNSLAQDPPDGLTLEEETWGARNDSDPGQTASEEEEAEDDGDESHSTQWKLREEVNFAREERTQGALDRAVQRLRDDATVASDQDDIVLFKDGTFRQVDEVVPGGLPTLRAFVRKEFYHNSKPLLSRPCKGSVL